MKQNSVLLISLILTCSTLMSNAQTSSPSTDGLVVYFPLDETSGNVVHDYMSGANGRTEEGTDLTWAKGKFGNALSCNGVDQKVFIPNSISYNYTGSSSYSLSSWVFVPSVPTSWQGVMAKILDQANFYGLWIGMQDGVAKWTYGNEYENNYSAVAVTKGWHHVVLVQTGGKNCKIYVDGKLEVTSKDGRAANATSNSPFILGAEVCPPQNKILHFKGLIDEVRLYKRAFTDAQIVELYNAVPAAPIVKPEIKLSKTILTGSAEVNLSTEGNLDWAAWTASSTGSVNPVVETLKSTIHLVDRPLKLGTPEHNFVGLTNDEVYKFSWSNGTTLSSATNVSKGISVTGLNNGVSIGVPCSTEQQTIKLYAAVSGGSGILSACFSDASIPALVDSVKNTDHSTFHLVYNISYKTADTNPHLWLKYTVSDSDTGQVMLYAAALADGNATGISNIKSNNFKVYPNPSSEFIRVNTNQLQSNIELFDLTGKLLLQKSVADMELVNLSKYKGLYLLKCTNELGVGVQKIEIH